MITKVSANIDFLNFSKLGHLNEDVFIEVIQVFSGILQIKKRFTVWTILVVRSRVLVHNDDGLTFGRLVVQSAASLAISAGTYFEVKWAIDPIL